jgi:hypothetical protein
MHVVNVCKNDITALVRITAIGRQLLQMLVLNTHIERLQNAKQNGVVLCSIIGTAADVQTDLAGSMRRSFL